MTQRRDFLIGLGAAGLMAALPKIALGAKGDGPRVLVVLLRGAMDGLDALRPYADPTYARLRGALADASDGGQKLNGTFALHPSLVFMGTLFARKQLLPVIAVAPPYRQGATPLAGFDSGSAPAARTLPHRDCRAAAGNY